jgi:hypothetical protein
LAAQIKTFEPIYLYRYRPLGEGHFHDEMSSIRDDYLWCSNFEALNDPMEGSYSSSLNLTNHDRYRFVKDKIYDQKSAFGICSFSETHDNGPMWAHYADQFRGICIAYNFQELQRNLADQCSFVRILYGDEPCMVTQKLLSDGETAQRILSSKSYRWLHEREWRLFSPSHDRLPLGANCISRVYVGNRMTDTCKDGLLAVLADKHIEARAMKLDGYRIEFSKLQAKGYTLRPGLEDEID